MYTVKAIPNDGDDINIIEGYTTYNDAKERALSLVHFMHKDAKVFTQSGTLLFHITFGSDGFEEKEHSTMNPTRNKIAEIKAVRAVGDWGLREAKEFVEARTTEQVAMYVMENVYAATANMRSKLSGYDQVQSSLDLYKKDFNAMVKTLDEKDNHIDALVIQNHHLINQRNTILAMLTKEQILDLYIASQSQTE